MDISAVEKGEFKASVKFEKGVVVCEAGYDGKGADAGAFVKVESDYFFDKLAEAIPGKIDDAVLALIKQAVKAL